MGPRSEKLMFPLSSTIGEWHIFSGACLKHKSMFLVYNLIKNSVIFLLYVLVCL